MSVTEVTPLESTPEAFNDLLQKVGVTTVKTVDVFSFDDPLPSPQHAVIMCFPNYTKVAELLKPEYEATDASNASNVFFALQKIKNACGTFALFNALANTTVDHGSGSFAKWLTQAKDKSPEERSDLLASDNELISAHENVAKSGKTDHSGNIQHHYVCYVNVGGKLFLVDSSGPFPLQVGTTTGETLVKDAGAACQGILSKLDNVSFAALAVVPQ